MLTRIQHISKFHGRTKKLGLFFLEFLVQAEADQFGTSFFFTVGKAKDTRSLFKINLMYM